jgi:type II secretory pathway pseudopilin PulG
VRNRPAGTASPPRAGDRAAGFTAVELMIGIAFFGILVMGFLNVFPLGVRTIEKGELMTVASSLAQNQLEQIKTLPFADPDLVAGNHVDPANPIRGVFARSWVVTDDTPLAGMKKVDVSISYSDNGVPRTVLVSTYLAP